MDLKALLKEAGRGLRVSAARAAGLLPGSSTSFGPPRRYSTALQSSEKSNLTFHPLIPARTSVRPVAEVADPPLEALMMQPFKAAIREVFVAELPHGRYWGRGSGYIIDQNDTLITDLSPTFTPKDARHEGLDQLQLPPLKELPGKVAVINTLFGDNFHHWLLDTVPHFEWLRRAGWDFREIDHFIFPSLLLRQHIDTLALLGIDKSKVICSTFDTHLRADLLIAPSHSEPGPDHWEYDYTPEGLRYVRELYLANNPFLQEKHPARIIVSREKAKSRRLVQADKANQLLAAEGFEKLLLEDYSVQQQAAFFHQAECIIMPTGGNLANLVFCRPGTVVLELFSKNYAPNFTHALMGEIGLRYYGLVAEKISRPTPDARQSGEDVDIEPERLVEIVRSAFKST